jgi:hypothetical protein
MPASRASVRSTAVGKKNWLFIGDEEAGERSAIVFALIEACRRRGINPIDYLRDVFTRMPTMSAADYPSLAPDEWAKHHKVEKPAIKVTAATKSSSKNRRCA